MNVREDAAGGNGDAAKELVELLIVLDGEGDVPGDNPARVRWGVLEMPTLQTEWMYRSCLAINQK